MRTLSLPNPFGAPVYWVESTGSTMDASRRLAAEGAAHGTVIGADFQEAGRGRVRGRPWLGRAGESLFATILLRCPAAAMPPALTLRTGLALAQALEDFAPALAGRVKLKWPNDIMIESAGAALKLEAALKAAGILAEGDGTAVYIGFGVNLLQTEFPEELKHKAVSLNMALPQAARHSGPPLSPESRFSLLEKILARLHQELADPEKGPAEPWQTRLEGRLYRRNKTVRFIPGAAGSDRVVEGRLTGIGDTGELLILPPGASRPLSFITGELDTYLIPPPPLPIASPISFSK
jgi:BirA family biotin operon repressor/biotin-[acetyl-CoA-carboxylase] ligase